MTFKVDGPILGYRASRARAFDPKYKAYKQRVRILANVAGIPEDLDKAARANLRVVIHWKNRARIDGKNVYAAVEDALFRQDRRITSGWFQVYEYRKEECLLVDFVP